MKKCFSFIEAPIYQGQKHFGVALGPAYLRQCLADQNYKFENFSVTAQQNSRKVQLKPYEELSYLVEREVRRKRIPFVAGGDHSLSIGSIQGLLRYEPDLKVVWVDAHGDVNTRKSSLTGSFHGMPLAFLLGEERFSNQSWFSETLKPENLIYYGVRDLDLAEKRLLDKKRIVHYSSADISRRGTTDIAREIAALTGNSKVHLSVDSDAFDPFLAPSTGVKVENGLDLESVKYLIQQLGLRSEIISYEYVELNPQIMNTQADVLKTAQLGIDLFQQILINQKQKETFYGSHDRQCYSAEPDLFHSNF